MAFVVVLRILVRILGLSEISRNLLKRSSNQIEVSNPDISFLFLPKMINIRNSKGAIKISF